MILRAIGFMVQAGQARYRCAVDKRGNSAGHLKPPRSGAFLLAQIGAHAAAKFADRLRELSLVPAHAGILRAVAASSGISQQGLVVMLGTVPSRLVALLDELEERGLLERREHAVDRRLNALHVTNAGMKTMAEIGRLARAHDDAICASLTAAEREQLNGFLDRIAEEQHLTPGVHPNFARIGEGSPGQSARRRPGPR
jgi:DNA-binding MarR family transcriptional regulator